MDMPAGQPTKLTKDFIAVAQKIIQGEDVVYLTDDDLLFLINEELEESARISESCFQKWKAGKVPEDTNGKEFLRLIKKALIKEKSNLMKEMKGNPQWTQKAWIVERKFKEWRMPNKFEIGGDPDNNSPITIVSKVPQPDASH